MRLLCNSLLLIGLTLLVAACDGDGNGSGEANRDAPTFTDYRGKWVVINYWAQWCKPCIHEIPELNALAAAEADRVVVLGVDYDNHQGPELQAAIDKLGITFAVLASDPAATLGIERPNVLPTTVLVDPEGAVREVLRGPQTRASLQRTMGLAAGTAP